MPDVVDPISVAKVPVNHVGSSDPVLVSKNLPDTREGHTADLVVNQGKLDEAAAVVQSVVDLVSETALSFSIESELSRTVVAVRAVGSDEIIRQFPPEEFLTVAKFLAGQDVENMSGEYLKGILFDEHT